VNAEAKIGSSQPKARFLAAMPEALRVDAGLRYETHSERLIDRLTQLYGDMPEFEYWLGELLHIAGSLYADRPAVLRRLDVQRVSDPGWFSRQQMLGYCAYVDRFGGTLRGVAARVPYLREIGVTYLHLLPFLKMRDGDNDGGFAVSSFDQVEPRLGSMGDLVSLTAQLREAGISLCADFVLNHVADDHPWAQAAAAGVPQYRDYFHTFSEQSELEVYERHLGEVFPEVAPGNFIFSRALGRWVWATFYPYQWDLNYQNPAVFAEMAAALLRLANRGVEVFRLDSAPFLWKRLGTNCLNQPEVHWILQALRALIEIVAPGVLLKAEAIVPVSEVSVYFGTRDPTHDECHLAYHSSLMAASWAALAEQRTDLLRRVIAATPTLPESASWLTYIRCHDDIVWGTLRPEAQADGLTLDQRLGAVSRFLAGTVDSSFAAGSAFQALTADAVFGTNGMAAALVGFSRARNERERTYAERRLLLLYSVAFCFGGLPLIYMGDELAQGNDESEANASLRQADGRWLQRPVFDEQRLALRHEPHSVPGRVFAGVRRLIECRRNQSALAANVSRRVVPALDPALLILARGERFVIAMNFSNDVKQVDVAIFGGGDWLDCLENTVVNKMIELEPWCVRWLERRS